MKLGKKASSSKGTLMAYACYCGSCPCSAASCTCGTNASAAHRQAMSNANYSRLTMSYAALQIG